MASTYSTNLKLELMGTGDQSGTWGDTTNTNMGTLLEQAVVGYTTQAITDGADTVLTIANGASSVARNYVLQLTGTLTANRNLIVPAIQKPYIIHNATTGGFSVTVKVSGQTGVTVANGKRALVYNNGTDIIEFANAPVTEAGTQTLTNKTLTNPTINGFTGSTAVVNIGSGQIYKDTSGNVGIGTTTPASLLNLYSSTTASTLIQADGVTNLILARSSTDASEPVLQFRKYRGTTSSPTTVASADAIGGVSFRAYGGTTLRNLAFVSSTVDTYTSDSNISSYLSFGTTPGGSAVNVERFRIGPSGQWGIGGATYGSAGAMFMSNGASAAPSWQKPGTRVSSAASIASPLAWNSDNFDQYAYTALANALTISADAGTPVDGQKAVFRIQDNGTARVLTFTGGVSKGFEPVGVSMTTSGSNFTYTTTINKKTYFGCIYNAADARWDIVAIAQEA